MADEQPSGSETSIESRIAAVFAAPATPETAPEAAPESAPELAPELAAPEQAPEDDFDDLDVDGTNYRVPKALKAKATEWQEANQRWGDYTRKTQEVADLHRHVATIAETFQMRQQFDQSTADERNELARVSADMQRYKGLDWTSLDIDSHVKLRTQLEQLKERAGELEGTINSKAKQFTQANETKRQEIIDHGTKYLSKVIPKWGSAETSSEVVKAGPAYGYSHVELDKNLDPRLVHMLYDLSKYRSLLAGKDKALETAQKAPPIIKPGASKGQHAEVNQRFKDTRQSLRKSGSVDDAARLIQMMSK